MKLIILLIAFPFISGCIQPPRPMSYYLAEQQAKYETTNKVQITELKRVSAENSCDVFWHRVRNSSISKMSQLDTGQICLDIKNQIFSLPTVYISQERIAFTKSHNGMKLFLAAIQAERLTIKDGLKEINDLYDANAAIAARQISNSNALVAQGEANFKAYVNQVNESNKKIEELVKSFHPKISTTTCTFASITNTAICRTAQTD